jgi:glycosyltransferase involved in cell wall biosynthesis
VADQRPLVFSRPVTQMGGVEKSTIGLIRELNKKHRVVVLDFYGCCGEYLDLLERSNITYRVVMPEAQATVIGGKNKIDRAWRLWRAYREMTVFVTKLRAIVEELSPKVIWFSDDKTLYCVGRALRQIGSPPATVMYIRGDIGKVKLICRPYWRSLHCIVGNNNVSLRAYEKYGWAKDKLRIAYNGIDVEGVRRAAQLPLADTPPMDSPFRVILPAMLIPLKAQDVAIRGFAKFRSRVGDSVLWLCGNTPTGHNLTYENSLRRLVRDLKIEENVHFLGWREDVPALIKQANVMILTSTTEGLPRSVLEAMAVGTPVISTKAGGIIEVITDGFDGMLIEIGDHNALAGKLLDLTNQHIAERLTNNAAQTVERRFTAAKQAEEFEKHIGVNV